MRVIRALNTSVKVLERSIAAHLGEHPRRRDLHVAATLGSGQRRPDARPVGRLPPNLPLPEAVASLAGAAPVTKKSGKYEAVHFRWACDKRFRRAMTTFADNSRHASPWAADIYQRATARGCDHPHAIRVLARAWARVIWRCWQDSVGYDPAKHGAAIRLVAPAAPAPDQEAA